MPWLVLVIVAVWLLERLFRSSAARPRRAPAPQPQGSRAAADAWSTGPTHAPDPGTAEHHDDEVWQADGAPRDPYDDVPDRASGEWADTDSVPGHAHPDPDGADAAADEAHEPGPDGPDDAVAHEPAAETDEPGTDAGPRWGDTPVRPVDDAAGDRHRAAPDGDLRWLLEQHGWGAVTDPADLPRGTPTDQADD